MACYRIKELYLSDLKDSIQVPPYQRPVVWTQSERNKFITSLHRGFPFGSLLLYKYKKNANLDSPYTLIDGQQRYTTMIDYSEHPVNYFPIGDYDFVERLLEITHALDQPEDAQNSLKGSYTKAVEELLAEHSRSPKIKPYQLRNKIYDIFPSAKYISEAEDELLDLQADIVETFNGYLDLGSIVIPCILFEGDECDLPDVFASVNLGGRKLTKYQVFAAQWNDCSVPLAKCDPLDRILENVLERYEKLTTDRGGIEIEDFDPQEMRERREVTLPEFCHALGEEILRITPSCWGSESKQDDAVDTIGYNTLAIVFGIKPKDINSLAKTYHESGLEKSQLLIENLVNATLHEYHQINCKFARYLRRPGNKMQEDSPKSFENTKAVSQHQFLSFFAALWSLKYGFKSVPDFECKAHYKDQGYNRTLNNLFGSYLIDYLNNQWRGAGDSRLAGYIDGTRNYLTGASRDSILETLKSWYEQERQTPSINIDAATKILLTVFASSHPHDYKASSYDFEHIIARKWLNEKCEGGIPRYKKLVIPGGRIGNIMLLDSTHNRRKGARNLGIDACEELKIDQERNHLPDKSQLNDAEWALRGGDPEPFLEFTDKRVEKIFETIADCISA